MNVLHNVRTVPEHYMKWRNLLFGLLRGPDGVTSAGVGEEGTMGSLETAGASPSRLADCTLGDDAAGTLGVKNDRSDCWLRNFPVVLGVFGFDIVRRN
jgi:hypothetical protein